MAVGGSLFADVEVERDMLVHIVKLLVIFSFVVFIQDDDNVWVAR